MMTAVVTGILIRLLTGIFQGVYSDMGAPGNKNFDVHANEIQA